MPRPRVLWIDDDEVGTTLVQILVSAEGILLDCAPNGRAGLSLALLQSYELVLIDLELPDGSGLDVLKALRSVRTPKVLVTGFATVSVAVDAMRLGASDVIEKPFNVEDLTALLHACRTADARAGKKRPSSPAEAAPYQALVGQLLQRPGRSLGETSRSAGLSTKAATQVIRERTGMSWRTWHRRVLMQHAARTLRISNAPLKALAETFGYGSIQAFSRTFRHVLGVSPGQYRRRAQRDDTTTDLDRLVN